MYFDTSITPFTRRQIVSAVSRNRGSTSTLYASCRLREFLRPENDDSARRLNENLNPSSVVNAENIDLAKLDA